MKDSPMFLISRLVSALLFIGCVYGSPVYAKSSATRITCYAVAFRKGGQRPEARTQAIGYKDNELFLKRRALINCQMRFPKKDHYTCVQAGCAES
jgi:hypothetical protein